jgi:hypothetical protein
MRRAIFTSFIILASCPLFGGCMTNGGPEMDYILLPIGDVEGRIYVTSIRHEDEIRKNLSLANLALGIVHDLAEGNVESAYGLFSNTYRSKLTKEQLKKNWNQIIAQKGALSTIEHVTVRPMDILEGVAVMSLLQCSFEEGELVVFVYFDNDGNVSDFSTVDPEKG